MEGERKKELENENIFGKYCNVIFRDDDETIWSLKPKEESHLSVYTEAHNPTACSLLFSTIQLM